MRKKTFAAALFAAAGLSVVASAQPASTDLGTLAVPQTINQVIPSVGAGQVIWFRMTVPAIATPVFLDMFTSVAGTFTNGYDTELGVYRADGTLVASDDDDGPGLFTALSFGAGCTVRPAGLPADGVVFDGRDGPLTPGVYYIAFGQFNVTFNATGFDVPATSGLGSALPITMTLVTGTTTPSVPPATPTDLGTVALGGNAAGTFTLAPGATQYFSVTLPAITRTAGGFLDIVTDAAVDTNTIIQLYSSDGRLILTDTDDGPAQLSALSIGTQCIRPNASILNPALAVGVNNNGRDLVDLAAGTYVIAVSGGGVGGTTCFGAFPTTHTVAGDVTLRVNTGTLLPAVPAGTVDAGSFNPAVARTFTDTFTLDPAEIRFYAITLPSNLAVPGFLDISTDGPFDVNTTIGLYRTDGSLVLTDFDDGAGLFSALSFGGFCPTRDVPNTAGSAAGLAHNGRDGASLAAGTYYLAVTGTGGVFGACFGTTSTSTASGDVTVNISTGIAGGATIFPPASPNLGTLVAGVPTTTSVTLGGADIQYVSFTLPTALSGQQFLDITTDGSFQLDSLIALYRADGTRVAIDDDDGVGTGVDRFSSLSFGAGCQGRLNTSGNGLENGVRLTGQDGGTLAAGQYFLAVTGAPATLSTNCPAASTTTHFQAGQVDVRISLGTTPSAGDFIAGLGASLENLGALSGTVTRTVNLAGNDAFYFRFSVPAITAASQTFLDISTDGSFTLDTEIHLYRADGTLVSTDDDDGPGAAADDFSALSYGAACVGRTNASAFGGTNGIRHNGRDGATAITAGEYILVVTGFDPAATAACIANNPLEHFQSGSVDVRISTGTTPAGPGFPANMPNLGSAAVGTTLTGQVTLNPGEVQYVQFTVPATVDRAANQFIDLVLDGPSQIDTIMALYNLNVTGSTAGTVRLTDDDDGPGNFVDTFSAITIGARCSSRFNTSTFPGVGGGAPLDGRDAATLPAGTYVLAISGFPTTFDSGCPGNNAPTHTIGGQVNIRVTTGLAAAPTPPVSTDLGTLVAGTPIDVPAFNLAAGTTRWFSFTLPAGGISVAGANFLDIFTDSASGQDFDTAIYLFEAADNNLEDSDNNDGAGFHSALSYGTACPTRTYSQTNPAGPTVGLIGQDGTALAAGTWYLAVTGVPSAVSAVCPVAQSGHTSDFTDLTLGIRFAVPDLSSVPPPASTNLGTIGVNRQGLLVDDAAVPALGAVWYRFTLSANVVNNDANDYFLDIDSRDSGADTEIGLYRAGTGALEDSDDDSGPGFISQLSYGDTTARPALGDGAARTGQNGGLTAGEYYISLSGFNTNFGPASCPYAQQVTTGGAFTGDLFFDTNIPGGNPPAVGCNVADIVSIGGFPPADGELTVDDYTSFINAFAGDELLADIVSIGGFPPSDGELTVDDYTSFINAFAEGCPG